MAPTHDQANQQSTMGVWGAQTAPLIAENYWQLTATKGGEIYFLQVYGPW